MARIQKWSWMQAMNPILSLCLMILFQQQGHSLPSTSMGWQLTGKWCEMTWVFQLCLGFDSHTTSFWLSTANCDESWKNLSKALSDTRPKKNNSSTSFTESKMLCTGNCSVDEKCQPGLNRIWVLQPNKKCKACESLICFADFSLQFLEPWQCRAAELWYLRGRARTPKQLQAVNKQCN